MRPSLHRGRAWGKVKPGGFTLLAILIIVAALTLLAGTALYRGMEERRNTSLVRHDAAALALAEVGLERTRAYLDAILAREPDLDLALDPKLDTNCSSLFDLTGNVDDDNLPILTANTAAPEVADDVTLAHSNRRFFKVPHDLDGDTKADGAYLVRIDDNDDDSETLTAFMSTTGNNPGPGGYCQEGTDVLQRLSRTNLVRDRDRTVIITVIGIYPGTNEATAQARKVLRVRVGPRQTTGVIAGGNIALGGNAAVCGQFGNVMTTGNVSDGCFCGDGNGSSGCCDTGNASNCVVEAAGTCATGLKFGNSQSVCIPGSSIPPPPKVRVWSSTNGPGKCNPVTGCTPFYYLRNTSTTAPGNVEVYMWNYSASGCDNPQACGRLFPPVDAYASTPSADIWPCATACWKKVYSAAAGLPASPPAPLPACPAASASAVLVADLAAAVPSTLKDPNPTWPCGSKQIWLSAPQSPPSSSSSCDRGDGPSASTTSSDVLGQHSAPGTTFSYFAPNPGSPGVLPPGVWLVEGNVTFTSSSPHTTCTPLPPPVTVLSVGSITVNAEMTMVPAHPMGILLLAGRDLLLDQGNSHFRTCGTSAAIMAHEELQSKGNGQLEAQIVAEDMGDCSTVVNLPDAISMNGTTDIIVKNTPPIAAGPQVEILEWSESSY
jgi:hypothetical protein